jgi:mono/diheme cytochrome c family protein
MRKRAVVLLAFAACTPSAGVESYGPQAFETERFRETYDRAQAGDATAENMVGYMLFYGSGVPANRPLAEEWFRSAAEKGLPVAQLNLAIAMHLGITSPSDPVGAHRWLFRARRNPDLPEGLSYVAQAASSADLLDRTCNRPAEGAGRGEQVFTMFCAGCHGLDGLARHPEAPSFAMGERLEKSDLELAMTAMGGHQSMPGWGPILPEPWIDDAIQFARTLEAEFQGGLLHRIRDVPDLSFDFGAMSGQYGGAHRGMPFYDSVDPDFDLQFCPDRVQPAD